MLMFGTRPDVGVVGIKISFPRYSGALTSRVCVCVLFPMVVRADLSEDTPCPLKLSNVFGSTKFLSWG